MAERLGAQSAASETCHHLTPSHRIQSPPLRLDLHRDRSSYPYLEHIVRIHRTAGRTPRSYRLRSSGGSGVLHHRAAWEWCLSLIVIKQVSHVTLARGAS